MHCLILWTGSEKTDFMAFQLLRTLQKDDIPSAMELSVEANWNQTPEDWQMLIELEPRGCLAIEVENEIAATTTAIFYGHRLAWIGMVLTRMQFRGQGLARRLLTEAANAVRPDENRNCKTRRHRPGQTALRKIRISRGTTSRAVGGPGFYEGCRFSCASFRGGPDRRPRSIRCRPLCFAGETSAEEILRFTISHRTLSPERAGRNHISVPVYAMIRPRQRIATTRR